MGKRLLSGLVAVVFVLILGVPASALAVSAPVAIGTGSHPEAVSVAVEGSGNAIAAWADTTTPGANLVRWCVLPVGGGACIGGGSLTPATGGAVGQTYIHRTQVLVEGSTLVILADLFSGNTEYESVQEWQSTNDGQTFTAVNGGKAVASGNPGVDTRALSAVTLPGAISVGVGFVTPANDPTFHAFSLAAPTLCGRATSPQTNCADGYATLTSGTNVGKVSNPPGNFAANADGVIGVFRTNASSGELGCTGGSPFGMAYAFGDGLQSPSNNYNVGPGKASTAWRRGVTLADCGVDYIAVGGGPSGFGVLEDNQATGQTQYHRFDSNTDKFDTAPTVVSSNGEQQPSVSQDGGGGVYATYLSGGIGGPVSLSYSADGGTSWTGPGTLSPDPLGAIAGLTSAVDPSGQGWATWIEDGSVFVQPFTAADAGSPPAPRPSPPASSAAPTTLTTSQKAGGQTGASVSVPAGTVGETDRATISGANAAHAGGTIVYGLFSLPNCAGTSLIARSSVTVAGGVVPASTPIAATLAPGKYYWQASYGGDSANGASDSPCGSEVLTVTTPTAIAAAATSDGQTLTFGASCAVVPCTLQTTATAPGPEATSSAVVNRKTRAVTLGKGKFRITKKGPRELTLKLSGRGRRYFMGKHGKVKVTLAVSQQLGGHNVVTSRVLSVKVFHHRRSAR